jgi:hypothetical protein
LQRETYGREIVWVPAFRLRQGFGGQVAAMTESGKHQRDSGFRQDDKDLATTPNKQIFTTKHGATGLPLQFTPN